MRRWIVDQRVHLLLHSIQGGYFTDRASVDTGEGKNR